MPIPETDTERRPPDSRFMTPDDLAREYLIPKTTQAKWRWNGTGPAFCKLGARVMYRRADVDGWIERHVRTSTAANDAGGAK